VLSQLPAAGDLTSSLDHRTNVRYSAVEVFAPMVFCKECRQKVEDCPHFVYPITSQKVSVFDPKIETLAYEQEQRILEIAFKGGQVWQLLGVPPAIYQELRESTISSFLKFIAQRYKAAPVKTGVRAIKVPESESWASRPPAS
jgi:hypothetical protein